MIAAVAVSMRAKQVDRLFDYLVPSELLVTVGHRVEVPFGTRKVEGYVIALREQSQLNGEDLKAIIRILDQGEPALTPELVDLLFFLRDRYMCTWGAAVQTLLPPITRSREQRQFELGIVDRADCPLSDELIHLLQTRGAVTEQTLCRRIGVSKAQLSKWVREQWLTVSTQTTPRRQLKKPRKGSVQAGEVLNDLDNAVPFCAESSFPLTVEQATALREVIDAMMQTASTTFVLRGVTGSGKTEVYLQAMEHALSNGRSAIMLVPEIALTAQMTGRVKRRFGDHVAVLHSHLTDREKYEEWHRIRSGEATIVIGARSAIFAPLVDIGLVVVDEEHETTYKQENDPRYVVREVAARRADWWHSSVVLGSATPSLEAMYRCDRGRYRLLDLRERIGGGALPSVEVIDMRAEFRQGQRALFSRSLQAGIRDRLERHEQVILFLNRRGYSTFLLCRDCGDVANCPSCDISLTLHRGAIHTLRCHYCGHTEPVRTICRSCGSTRIRQFGAGTQRVEHELLEQFPEIRVIRMDVDTTGTKGAHERLLNAFERGEADVLLGTQMIAKGLDFKRVSLVGVIAADTSLRVPDFRAAERTFQLLVQVAGRAGRHSTAGHMIVQTFTPEHYAIQCACKHDYEQFYSLELPARRRMSYPPFSELTQFVIAHATEGVAREHAVALHRDLAQRLANLDGVHLLSAVPAPAARLRDLYRYQVLVSYRSFKTVKVALYDSYLLARQHAKDQVSVSIDVNAQYIS